LNVLGLELRSYIIKRMRNRPELALNAVRPISRQWGVCHRIDII
jgi:hypothetical protein